MFRRCILQVLSLASLFACGSAALDSPVLETDGSSDSPVLDAGTSEDGSTVTGPAPDAAPPDENLEDGSAPDATARDASPPDAGPSCAKHLTIVFAVGTGAGSVGSLSNGCWDVVDADGAANHAFRKCSTSNFAVTNPSAANYAYDDTNPTRAISQDQTFLSQCSSGATGTGFEFMAYRGGAWRLLTATHMKAYFAELYSSDQTIDDYLSAWPKTLSGHQVSPMINIGPNDSKTIGSAASSMCHPLADGGYFGVYNGDWQSPMAATDARAKALATALNGCTGP